MPWMVGPFGICYCQKRSETRIMGSPRGGSCLIRLISSSVPGLFEAYYYYYYCPFVDESVRFCTGGRKRLRCQGRMKACWIRYYYRLTGYRQGSWWEFSSRRRLNRILLDRRLQCESQTSLE